METSFPAGEAEDRIKGAMDFLIRMSIVSDGFSSEVSRERWKIKAVPVLFHPLASG